MGIPKTQGNFEELSRTHFLHKETKEPYQMIDQVYIEHAITRSYLFTCLFNVR